MEQSLITIIIPVYRVEKYLRRCLESIIHQTYSKLEIILVDDGSPDDCPRICDEYMAKDSRCRVIHKLNGGPSSAKNAGLAVACGEYITFADSDDWLDKNYVQKLYRAIMDYDTKLAACKFCIANDEDSVPLQKKQEIQIIEGKARFYSALIDNGYDGFVCGKLFSSKIIHDRKLLFDEQIFIGEDMLFTMQYLQFIQKVAFLSDELYFYFCNPKGLILSGFSQSKLSALRSRENILQIIEHCAPEYCDIVIASYLFHLIKFKYLLYPQRLEEAERYHELEEKLQRYQCRILHLNGISIKKRVKLFLMVYFSWFFGFIYRHR